jgi:single-strand DNA-binding protein
MKEETEWVSVVAWNKLAETCNQYLNKGQMVYLEGRLHTRSWEDKSGVKQYRTEIIANQVLFLSQSKPAPGTQSEDDGGGDINSADLPF